MSFRLQLRDCGWGADPNAIIYGDTDRYRFTHLETLAGTVDVSGNDP